MTDLTNLLNAVDEQSRVSAEKAKVNSALVEDYNRLIEAFGRRFSELKTARPALSITATSDREHNLTIVNHDNYDITFAAKDGKGIAFMAEGKKVMTLVAHGSSWCRAANKGKDQFVSTSTDELVDRILMGAINKNFASEVAGTGLQGD